MTEPKKITQVMTVPVRGAANFSTNADAFASQLNPLAQQINEVAQEISEGASIVANGLPTILAAANFKGAWSGLAGALNTPASVFHNETFWQLVSNVANVTAKVPGIAPEWKQFVIQTRPAVPTGEVVPAGNLLGVDDAGNTVAVGTISPTVVQVASVNTFGVCPLANGNTAIVSLIGSDLRLSIVSDALDIVKAPASIGTAQAASQVTIDELTNGNLVVGYMNVSGRPAFKIVSTAGADVIAQTEVEAASGSDLKIASLTGGGFAAVYFSSPNNAARAVIFSNTGVPNGAFVYGSGAYSYTAIAKNADGSFAALAANPSGQFWVSRMTVPGLVATNVLQGQNLQPTPYIGITTKVGFSSISYAYGVSSKVPVLNMAPTGASGSTPFAASFPDPTPVVSKLGMTSACLLGDGSSLHVFVPYTSTTDEFPRFIVVSDFGHVLQSGFVINELVADSTPMFVVPKGVNGRTYFYLDRTSRNIKALRVKSGFLIGVSAGQSGPNTMFDTHGSVSLSNAHALNIGGAKISYNKLGTRVVI